ncbi:hypothetical protein BKA81DRAFT_134116 [Phyllosticta paracitricarpa]
MMRLAYLVYYSSPVDRGVVKMRKGIEPGTPVCLLPRPCQSDCVSCALKAAPWREEYVEVRRWIGLRTAEHAQGGRHGRSFWVEWQGLCIITTFCGTRVLGPGSDRREEDVKHKPNQQAASPSQEYWRTSSPHRFCIGACRILPLCSKES